MPAAPNNYDKVAAFYDRLSLLIFGGALRRAQKFLLSVLHPGQRVLIVGGGSGWILEAMAARVPEGLHITYIEISANMTALAREKQVGKNEVVFINDSITTQQLAPEGFDLVFTAFLFDNFPPAAGTALFAQLHHALKPGGYWLFADFELAEGRGFWQRPLLKAMYFFFGALCQVQARQLNDMGALFRQYHYKLVQQKDFYGRFVNAAICEKA